MGAHRLFWLSGLLSASLCGNILAVNDESGDDKLVPIFYSRSSAHTTFTPAVFKMRALHTASESISTDCSLESCSALFQRDADLYKKVSFGKP